MRSVCLVLFASALGLMSAGPARSQWIPNGAPVSGGIYGDLNPIVSDGAGGAYVAWRRSLSGSNTDVYLQHLAPTGEIWSGWPASGLPLVVGPQSEDLMGMIADGEGGAIVIWTDFQGDQLTGADNVIQRIRPDGSPAPGWPANGLRILAPRRQDPAVIAADGAGGAFVLWRDTRNFPIHFADEVYALHVLGDGTIPPGWPTDGLALALGPEPADISAVIEDGAGGAFFQYVDLRNGLEYGEPFGVRLHSDGTVANGWTAEGRLLAPAQFHRGSCSDGVGGFYLWTTGHSDFLDEFYYLRRFGPDGNPAPGWPVQGILVCNAPGWRSGAPLIPDGEGGVIAAWTDYRTYSTDEPAGVYALRVQANGTLAPGWTANGTLLSNPAGPFGSAPFLVPDEMGGAFVVWDEGGPSSIQHVTRTGQPAPGWPPYGMRLANTSSQFDARIAGDGEGGAIVAWNEACCGRTSVWAQRYVADGIVAVQLALVSATAQADRVRLEWFAADGAGLAATVQRRHGSESWRDLAAIVADGTGHLRYEDYDVSPGTRYNYRLAYRDAGVEQFSAETGVEIPAAFQLALEGFRPNPAVGSPLVAFTLPESGPGRLEVFDLAGRRVAERDLGGLPAGRHVMRVGETAALPPSAYVVRLSHESNTVTTRGVVVR